MDVPCLHAIYVREQHYVWVPNAITKVLEVKCLSVCLPVM